jgi:hypothetical protein
MQGFEDAVPQDAAPAADDALEPAKAATAVEAEEDGAGEDGGAGATAPPPPRKKLKGVPKWMRGFV